MRLIIDTEGTVQPFFLVVRQSAPEFRSSIDAVVAAMRFEPATEGVYKSTLNEFRVDVMRGKVDVQQFTVE